MSLPNGHVVLYYGGLLPHVGKTVAQSFNMGSLVGEVSFFTNLKKRLF